MKPGWLDSHSSFSANRGCPVNAQSGIASQSSRTLLLLSSPFRRRIWLVMALLGACLSMGCETMTQNIAADKFAGRLPPQTEVLE